MAKWKYEIKRLKLHFDRYDILSPQEQKRDMEHNLDTMGKDGWEMMSCVHIGDKYYECVFKRKVSWLF